MSNYIDNFRKMEELLDKNIYSKIDNPKYKEYFNLIIKNNCIGNQLDGLREENSTVKRNEYFKFICKSFNKICFDFKAFIEELCNQIVNTYKDSDKSEIITNLNSNKLTIEEIRENILNLLEEIIFEDDKIIEEFLNLSNLISSSVELLINSIDTSYKYYNNKLDILATKIDENNPDCADYAKSLLEELEEINQDYLDIEKENFHLFKNYFVESNGLLYIRSSVLGSQNDLNFFITTREMISILNEVLD